MLIAHINNNQVKPHWMKEALQGYILMRKGAEYENKYNKYGRAYITLHHAYKEALKANDVPHTDIAQICLWIGISLNENLDIHPFTKRNEGALKWYKLGLHYLSKEKVHNKEFVLLQASLYNSIGVSYHHKTTRWTTGGPIPQSAIRNYNKARDIIIAYPQYKSEFAILAEKIESNSGRQVLINGGGVFYTHGGNYACI